MNTELMLYALRISIKVHRDKLYYWELIGAEMGSCKKDNVPPSLRPHASCPDPPAAPQRNERACVCLRDKAEEMEGA